MAGIGIELNRIFEKNTIMTNLFGFFYTTLVTVAPMFLIIGNILLMGWLLGFSNVGYVDRELFSCTVLYIFIFALLTAAPFNAVLSKYMSDIIYKEQFDNILACYDIGLLFNLLFSCILGIPFCIHEYFVGQVQLYYVFTGFFGYISLVLVFYTMLYLSICKDYKKISGFFFAGMVETFIQAVIMVKFFKIEVSYSMLLSLSVGFFVTAVLEYSLTRQYFKENSQKYKAVLRYFKKYWKLVLANFFYILGLYIHNFVFWTTDLKLVVVKSFVCCQPYDMATCLAMFTNISASILFIAKVEMHFHERYKAYSEAVIGGRWMDIDNAKKRMFGQMTAELMDLVRTQFMITIIIFLVCIIFLPQLGFGGLVMKIYPCLAAGYFILFTMYSAIIFLYYFDDLTGALLTAVSFCLGVLIVSIVATHLPEIWYGIGVAAGSFVGWTVAYFRIRWVERNLDAHVFCQGSVIRHDRRKMPSSKIYDARDNYRKGESTNG